MPKEEKQTSGGQRQVQQRQLLYVWEAQMREIPAMYEVLDGLLPGDVTRVCPIWTTGAQFSSRGGSHPKGAGEAKAPDVEASGDVQKKGGQGTQERSSGIQFASNCSMRCIPLHVVYYIIGFYLKGSWA